MTDGRRPCRVALAVGVRAADRTRERVRRPARGRRRPARVPERGLHRDRRRGRRGGAGDTISVCDGEYYEGASGPGATALTIDKPLTLRGAGAGRVYVGPSATSPPPSPNLRDAGGNIISVVGVDADLSGMTIHGAGRHVEAGVAYLNADGSGQERRDRRPRARPGSSTGVDGRRLLRLGQRGRRACVPSRCEDSLVEGYARRGRVVVDAALADGTSRTARPPSACSRC